MKKSIVILVAVCFLLSPLAGRDTAEKPAPISPGNGSEIGLVSGRTPTFSWSAVSWAAAYRVLVFPGRDAGNLDYPDVAALADPVLSKEIPGGATSWTPSYREKLQAGSLYVWFVQALDAGGAGEWSAGGRFVVLEKVSLDQPEDKLKETLWNAGVSPAEAAGLVPAGKTSPAPGVTPADTPAGDADDTPSRPLGNEGDSNWNVYYGTLAANSLGPGAYQNSFFGYRSGYSTSSGDYNTFIGYESGKNNGAGNNNTFIGFSAGYHNDSANHNTFVGYLSGFTNSTGGLNTYCGFSAGEYSTGSSNTFLGASAGCDSTGSDNVFLGHSAGCDETGSNKLYIENSDSSSPLIYGEFDNDLLRVNGNFQAAGYLSLNGGTNQINAAELNILDGKTLATGNAHNDQLVTKGYVDENDDVGGGLTGSDLTHQAIPKWDDGNTRLVDSLILEGAGAVGVNGRLGIGTQAPDFTLHARTTGENCMLVLDRTDGAQFKLSCVTNKVQIGAQSNHDVRFTTDNISRMVITNTGNVGINELHPTHLLQLGGGAYCDGGAWVNGSSRALKTNIRALDGGEAEAAVMNLRPVRFRYKADTAEEYLGFIAEDVPDLVAMKNRKGMTAMDVVAALTRVVQQQQETIRAQEKAATHQQRLILEQIKSIREQEKNLQELKGELQKQKSEFTARLEKLEKQR